ncbi:hypothetical protein AAE478_001016 [Parahypoxylon ruwenzoriense]
MTKARLITSLAMRQLGSASALSPPMAEAPSLPTLGNHQEILIETKVTEASGSSLAGKVYLGRPWRVLARVIFQYSTLTNVVNAAGWTTMAENATPIFQEYGNTGNGSPTSSRVYGTVATAAVTKSQLWPNGYSWIDTSY